MSLDNLVFDRTQSDVDNKTDKGKYRYIDLNRIESWCRYLADELTLYNYPVSIITKTDWDMTSFQNNPTNMERIRSNIATLKNAYYAFTSVPDNLERMTWQKANAIEKVLYEINDSYENMKAELLYSGTFYSGESEGLL